MDFFEKYYTLTLRFLKFRPRSEKEIRDYLLNKNAEIKIIEQVITKLKEKNFINDDEFARWFIEQRKQFRKKSDRLIKLELRQKGITQETFEQSIKEIENIKSDIEMARELARQKIEKYKQLSKQEIYQKLGGFLARRGFNWDTVKIVIDEMLKKGV